MTDFRQVGADGSPSGTPKTSLTISAVVNLGQHLDGTTTDFAERFWARVDQSGGPDACWPWTAGTFDTGYGCVWADGKAQRAHRIAWQLAHGPLGPDERVLHHCDNRPCCNPYGTDHLFAGSMKDNTADMVAKGRHNRDGRAHLTPAQVVEIRQRYAAGGETLKSLGAEYGVTNVAIHMVVKRKRWRDVA